MLILAAILSVIATAIIAFSSPIFAVLGFEYSTIMALALSFVCGIAAILRQRNKTTQMTEIRLVAVNSILLASVPLVISVISLMWLPNCSFGDGLVFYLEIAYPSAILGGLFGIAFAWLVQKRSKAVSLFIAFWIITLFLSFLPGYFNPQLFTYGWQYGFFPGITWDESLELTNSYLAFRAENILWVIFALSLANEIRLQRRPKLWFVIPGVISIALFGFHDALHITTSHDVVNKSLKTKIQPVPNCTVYYAPGSLTTHEEVKIWRDVQWYLHDIERRFALQPPSNPIRIYIYSSSDAMFDLIGTRTASISKPWLGEVHIAKENLESLKHELTHVMLRQKGVFPFYVSWSTGITEGAAMSVEPEYDGIYTLDEHAARILQLHYASGVREVMSFTGFAANASQKSYVLAGSFSRYLLSTYGSAPFDRVYASLDWQQAYGKPLDSLEAEWKRWLSPMMTPMDAEDSEHFRYYYDRASIIYNPCLRRIGKLQREASEAFHDHQYTDATALYQEAINEGGGISALFGAESALLRTGNWRGAMALLDTTHTSVINKQRPALDLQRADLHVMAGDSSIADDLYNDAELLKLNRRQFLLSYASRAVMHDYPDSLWQNYLKNEFTNPKWNLQIADSLLRMFYPIRLSILILRTDNFLHNGTQPHPLLIYEPSRELTENDSLAGSIYMQELVELGLLDLNDNRVNVCPVKYRRAAKELADEINGEWRFHPSPFSPGHGTYP
jgi:hypothetical protein